MWVELSRFPIKSRSVRILNEILDSLGKTLGIDKSFKLSSYMTVARILVEVYISRGLFDNMEIVVSNVFHPQLLDYYKI